MVDDEIINELRANEMKNSSVFNFQGNIYARVVSTRHGELGVRSVVANISLASDGCVCNGRRGCRRSSRVNYAASWAKTRSLDVVVNLSACRCGTAVAPPRPTGVIAAAGSVVACRPSHATVFHAYRSP